MSLPLTHKHQHENQHESHKKVGLGGLANIYIYIYIKYHFVGQCRLYQSYPNQYPTRQCHENPHSCIPRWSRTYHHWDSAIPTHKQNGAGWGHPILSVPMISQEYMITNPGTHGMVGYLISIYII